VARHVCELLLVTFQEKLNGYARFIDVTKNIGGYGSYMNRDQKIGALINGKKVVHIGCADWPYTERRIEEGRLLHSLLVSKASYCIGVDLNEDRLSEIRKQFPNEDFTTFAQLDEIPADSILVAGDVIEHIENPGDFLRELSEKSSVGTHMLVSTPNAQSLKQALRGLVGKEEQHPDHVVMFTKGTLTELAARYDWQLCSCDYYNSRTTSSSAAKRILRAPFEFVIERFGSGQASDGMAALFVKQL